MERTKQRDDRSKRKATSLTSTRAYTHLSRLHSVFTDVCWRNCTDTVASLLNTGKFSDVTITCGDKVWNLHRAIICSRSQYFQKAFGSDFKVRTWTLWSSSKTDGAASQESGTKTLHLEETDAELFQHVVTYMYSDGSSAKVSWGPSILSSPD